jgi:hypothetical protein
MNFLFMAAQIARAPPQIQGKWLPLVGDEAEKARFSTTDGHG